MTAGWRESVFGAIVALVGAATPAFAQAPMPPGPPPPNANPACVRLEAQLGAIDRGTVDPARADQIRRYEESSRQQQGELDRLNAQARRLGCSGGGFFSFFGGQSQQCTPINQQIQQTRANLERTLADLDRMQGGAAGDREAQRQTVIAALAQNNCGPQYRAAANQQRGFFDTIFGGNRGGGGGFGGGGDGGGMFPSTSGTYRTVCVRTCDGYYYPISYAATQDKFAEDAQTCQATCPAAEVVLMSNRTGDDINQAVSTSGAPYTSLANAFRYRKEVVPSCGCRQPGQSWLQALGQTPDATVRSDDIVVTPGVAKNMSVPRDSQGRPIRDAKMLDPKAAAAAASGAQAAAPSDEGDTTAPDKPKRPVRAVGPTFVPTR